MNEQLPEITMTIDVRIKDAQRFALLMHELQELIGRMRVEASPHAEALEHAFDRFVYGGDDDGEQRDDKQFTNGPQAPNRGPYLR